MNSNVLIGVLALFLIIKNQLKIREVSNERKFILPIILLVIGIRNFNGHFNNHTLSSIGMVSTIISFTLLAGGMAAIRAYTIKLWTQDNVIFRQGTWLTILLWFVSIGLHAGIDLIANIGQSTLLIYFAITLFVQNWVVHLRAKQI
ncbi:hypothetical protein [Priestia megaterium]|uniref:hypothetical protein n=1 Tax=Priestia megaterium TaxID=1404 RepID=UPI00336B66E2